MKAEVKFLSQRFYLWRPILVFVLTCWLWGSRMPFVQAYYQRTLMLNYYAPEADSIGIPIASNAVLTLMFFPILAIGLFLALRNFPARCFWWAWSKNHPFLSAFWTIIYVLFFLQMIPYIQENIAIKLPNNAAFDCAWLLIGFELRAVIVSKLDRKVSRSSFLSWVVKS